ncbi:signal transduction histidine kinase [Pseudonocardia hierapolitana]|uniref:histidine kinase n=1 Tax=Pseudonocardia hierapolitana TaxID=1128676 RepID=A0A561T5V4_9PSEU|nr:sensor histidine kinase [Pseudonocardia hierapolitana]TWF82491.1 signal transduction histidine kinase [Pseudonocardia hierapolitana]
MVIASPVQGLPHRDPLRALVAPPTWLAAAHLLLDALVGMASAFVVGMGLFLSVVLLPLALLGVPVWIVTTWVSAGLARLERTRYRVLLGVAIDTQPLPAFQRNPLRYGGVLWRDPGVRRRALHQLLAAPVGVLTSGITYVLLSGALALLAMPLLGIAVPADGTTTYSFPLVDTGGGRALLAGIGLVLLLAAPAVLRALAAADIALARILLGPVPELLARRVDELERSRARVVDAGEAERRRLERDLHDGTQQRLVALGMTLGRAKARYKQDPAAVGELLDDAHQQAKDAVTELRGLIRGLHPPVLTDRGLDAALSAIAVRCPVPVQLTVEIDERPSSTVEAIGYFVVAEALTNVARHSRAAQASVTVHRERGGPLWISITDDGVGGADPERGTGLRGLADRVSGVDGQLRVDSPVGGPTVLTVELPTAPAGLTR